MPKHHTPSAHIVWTRNHIYLHEDMLYFQDYLKNMVFLPTTCIDVDTKAREHFYQDMENIPHQNRIVFVTSPFIARDICKRIPKKETKNTLIACFGKTSKTLLQNHQFSLLFSSTSHTDISNADALAHALVEHCNKIPINNQRMHILYPKARITASNVESIFATNALKYHPYTLYNNRYIARKEISKKQLAFLENFPAKNLITTFASPSSFLAYANLGLPFGAKQIVIGKTTEQCLMGYNLKPITARQTTCKSLAHKAIQEMQNIG